MTASTAPPWSIPYPQGTDRVMDGDNAMQAIADRVHALLGQSLVGVPVPYTALTLNTGWTNFVQYAVRCGWVHLWINASKASWVAGEMVASVIPAAYCPKQDLYFAAAAASDGSPRVVHVTPSGTLVVVLAGTSTVGLLGHTSWPVPGGILGDPGRDHVDQRPTDPEPEPEPEPKT